MAQPIPVECRYKYNASQTHQDRYDHVVEVHLVALEDVQVVENESTHVGVGHAS